MDDLYTPKNKPFPKMEEFERVDFSKYESPIAVALMEQYRSHAQRVDDYINDGVYKQVLAIGVDVDKAELFKALAYDRNQYGKGYADGVRAAQPKWISVEERLPEIENENNTFKSTETVLAVDEDGYIYVGYFRIYKWDDSTEFCGVEFDGFCRVQPYVTHWMPLPEPPKEEVNEESETEARE